MSTDQVMELLHALANKLGTTSERLWAVLVRQAPISGVTNLLLFTLSALGITKLAQFWWKCLPDEGSYNRNDMLVPFSIVIGTLALMLSVEFMTRAEVIVADFFNPEFSALEYILRELK